MTKIFVTASLIIFLVVVVVIGVTALTSHPSGITGTTETTTSNYSQPAKSISPSQTPSKIILTMAEIAKHNSASDCWLLISGKVYDVTGYIDSHPGGRRAIISTCGTDATVAFETKDGMGSHSQAAWNLLSNYYIGDLNAGTSQATVKKTAQTQTPAVIGGDD